MTKKLIPLLESPAQRRKNLHIHVLLDGDLMTLIERAIKKMNEQGYLELSKTSITRQAIRFYCQQVLNDSTTVGIAFLTPDQIEAMKPNKNKTKKKKNKKDDQD
jgi:hypothetical protein